MFCKHCGHQIDDDSTFCSKCGQSLSGNSNRKSVYKQQKTGVANTSFSNLHTILNGVLAVACAIPLVFAEYYRLVEKTLNAKSLSYWLLAAPAFLSIFFLYRVIGAPAVANEKRKIEQEKEAENHHPDTSRLSNIKTNKIAICCFIIAIYAFAVSGILQLIF